MSESQIRKDLETAVKLMRAHASQVGPMHAWWDYIFDFEQHLREADPEPAEK
jgi:hypothetical protein